MYLIFSILIICLAHVIRVFRWELLIETYEKPDGVRLGESLSLGYFVNYFLPFKVGDLFRALYAGKGMQNGRGFALATVIVERCLDVITVGVMFIVFAAFGVKGAGYYIFLAGVVAGGLLLILLAKKYIKRLICVFGGLFNEKFEEKVLRFFWALVWGFKDVVFALPKAKLIFYTIVMWGLYLCSYGAFATYLEFAGMERGFMNVFLSLFDQRGLLASGLRSGLSMDAEAAYYAVFMLVPCVVVGGGAAVWRWLFPGSVNTSVSKNRDRVVLSGKTGDVLDSETEEHNNINNKNECKSENGELKESGIRTNEVDIKSERLNLLPQTNVDERRAFLKMYFAGEKREYIENYLKFNRNILVLRDYSAGSNATTILCTDGAASFYRKYAFGDAAVKLRDQIEWMRAHEAALPLAKVLRCEAGDAACYYDMPYSAEAVTMFEFLQTGDKEAAWAVIKGVIEVLEERLYKGAECVEGSESSESGVVGSDDVGSGSSDSLNVSVGPALDEYIDKKILANLEKVTGSKALRELMKYKTIVINGVEYRNLPEYKELFDRESLKAVFACDTVSDIHGDMTIENIVCVKGDVKAAGSDDADGEKRKAGTGEVSRGFYLIDPNTGNIFNSKFIDYAKLLQSLHGNYEFLMAVSDVSVEGNHIDFKFVKSEAYTYLYDKYREFLKAYFSEAEVKSIYYHEIVNWLRLMPYKLEKGRGELFYAGLLMILGDEFEE